MKDLRRFNILGLLFLVLVYVMSASIVRADITPCALSHPQDLLNQNEGTTKSKSKLNGSASNKVKGKQPPKPLTLEQPKQNTLKANPNSNDTVLNSGPDMPDAPGKGAKDDRFPLGKSSSFIKQKMSKNAPAFRELPNNSGNRKSDSYSLHHYEDVAFTKLNTAGNFNRTQIPYITLASQLSTEKQLTPLNEDIITPKENDLLEANDKKVLPKSDIPPSTDTKIIPPAKIIPSAPPESGKTESSNTLEDQNHAVRPLQDPDIVVNSDKNGDEGTIVESSKANALGDLTKEELLKKEIEKLNQELAELKKRVETFNKENQQLKLNLKKRNNYQQKLNRKKELVDRLASEVRTLRSERIDQDAPDALVKAESLLLVGDIDSALKQIQGFINEEKPTEKTDSNNNVAKDSKTKDSTNNKKANVTDETSSDKAQFYSAYAHYWLASIYFIQNNFKAAAENFTISYQETDDNNLSLMSLAGLVASLANLAQSGAACTAIKQFHQDYMKAMEDENFNLDQRYAQTIAKYKTALKCP